MIGVFDSGVGGLCAYRELRRMRPGEDMIYLADRKNAPYGTKGADEILYFTKNNIRLLKEMGAEAVLIACCSASSVYPMLNEEERAIATPIITPAAMEAVKGAKSIAVIATDHTVDVRAFGREIERLCDATVSEMAEQRLVSLVENGSRDGRVCYECSEYLKNLATRIRTVGADTLILGCTHFSHLEGEISRLLPEVRIISPARVGAKIMSEKIPPHRHERGRDRYI
ncbi:MAG: aspartate/glutamate racemase family protein [Clostridia bacterium]|nr:aspartate/glutamate racemase family protein [Clostridia bacterium]